MTKSVARLYQQFQPQQYDLTLDIDRDALTYSGSVTIRGKKVGRPSQRLTFHQKDLKVTSATITKHDKKGDQPLTVSRINKQNTLNEVRLHTEGMMYPGDYTITLEFSGTITKNMNGIYPCFFKHDGQNKRLIATQFESHFARNAFPCIDEPEAKAVFNLTLISEEAGVTALSNTPIKQQSSKKGRLTTAFEPTPKMSAYLLAFVYGELGYSEAETKDGVTVCAYATPDNAALTDFSLQVAVQSMEFFSDYFRSPYPLQKLDLVALPDFEAGAMENWGLLTFRETAMLAHPQHTSIESKQLVALVVSHEMSHQWFGDLVTMQWWDDLWLNESFANMMEYRAVDALFPEWSIWEQFVSHETASAKRRDSLVDVQPVHTAVNHPDEISTIFDPSIVYAKGGSILYMLKNYLGEEAFRAGLQAYFKKHAYGNTRADDLWAALSASSGQDVGAFMHKWLHSPGYPLVSVAWQPDNDKVVLGQRRFLSDPTAHSADTTPWQVPLAPNRLLSETLLIKTEASSTVSSAETALLLNHDGTSYFLPHYINDDHRQAIVKDLQDGKISTIDRLLLLDNYIMLQRGGVTATTDLLDLLQAYEGERSEMVWGDISLSIGEARKLIEGDEASEDKVHALVRRLVAPLAVELGWDDQADDTAQTLRLRGLAVAMAAGAKDQAMVDEGLRRFRNFTKPSDLSPSTRGVVYFCGVRYGTDEDFKKLLALHEAIQNADEKDEIASGLTSAKESEKYQQLIALLTSDHIRRQDLMHWYVWLLRNRYSRAAAWQWLKDQWDWIEKEFSSDKSFGYFARYGGAIFSTAEEQQEYNDFFEPKKSAIALNRDITLAQQEIASRVAWRQRNEAAVREWLAQR